MTEGLASMDSGEVDFDEGHRHRGQCISQGNTRVRKRARIDNEESRSVGTGHMDAVDQGTFVIALEKGEVGLVQTRDIREFAFDLGQRASAVDRRFPIPSRFRFGPLRIRIRLGTTLSDRPSVL
jgi:hypothetical protein